MLKESQNIDAYSTPISYKGHFYYRTGSTVQDLKGSDLEKMLLRKMGRKWDGVEAHGFGLDDISAKAIEIFRRKAKRSKRIPLDDINDTNTHLIESLGLSTNGRLKRAAVITFGKDPEKLITGAYVKIGYFKTHIDLLYQDEIHGSLVVQVEKTMDLLLTKYMKANIDYEGYTRTETFGYPEAALREALLNALVHKDYSSAIPIQISVYQDWLMIHNAGKLPEGWTVNTLKQKHISEPANPDIANAFFRAGYIESWGRGTLSIVDTCVKAGLPEPTFEDKWGGLAIVFVKKDRGEMSEEMSGEVSGEVSGEMSGEIIELIRFDNSITIPEIAEKIGASTRTIDRQLAHLQRNTIIKRIGSHKTGHWKILTKRNGLVEIKHGRFLTDSEKMSEKMSEKVSEKIIELIRSDHSITISAIAKNIGVSTRTIDRHLDKLKLQGILIRVGPDKGGHWEIRRGNEQGS